MFALAIAGSIGVGVLLSAVEVFAPPRYHVDIVNESMPQAASWLVFDVESGRVLNAHAPDTPYPIASITKFPAASVFYTRADMTATTTIMWVDTRPDGRAGRLTVGDTYTLHTLLFPLLLESSNDAAATLVRVYPTLIDDMNAYAASLDLQNTAFADASGLSARNVSTASELSVIMRDIYDRAEHIVDITGLPSYLNSINGWMNNNPFRDIPGYRGGKHGYTNTAGFTAIAYVDESFQNGHTRTIGYIILESDDLADDMAKLRAYVRDHVVYQ